MSAILLCGGTGLLGGQVAAGLRARGISVRALVRPGTDPSALVGHGCEIARGDLRDPASLAAALGEGVSIVVTSANAMSRPDLSIPDVDRDGNRNLVQAAERAGVERFVFVSAAGFDREPGRRTPFGGAKMATEELLRASPLREVLVRPDQYQDVWLSPLVGFDWPNRKVTVFGKGEGRARYVASSDVARLVVELTLADDPPSRVEFGGPEPLSRLEAVRLFEEALGESLRVRHAPRAVLRAGSRLGRVSPRLASQMGLGLHADLNDATWDDAPLREAGIEPRSTWEYVEEAVASQPG